MRRVPGLEIIAEVGVNHDGDLDTALELVDKAAVAGADTVKFRQHLHHQEKKRLRQQN